MLTTQDRFSQLCTGKCNSLHSKTRMVMSLILIPRCPTSQTFVNNACSSQGDTGIGGYECLRPGLFPDRADCRFYIFCNGNLVSQRIQCPTGTHFSPQSNSCIRGEC